MSGARDTMLTAVGGIAPPSLTAMAGMPWWAVVISAAVSVTGMALLTVRFLVPRALEHTQVLAALAKTKEEEPAQDIAGLVAAVRQANSSTRPPRWTNRRRPATPSQPPPRPRAARKSPAEGPARTR